MIIPVFQDLSYALPIFLFSLSVSTFCLSSLACCCLVRSSAPPPLGYLVSITRGSPLFTRSDVTSTTMEIKDLLTVHMIVNGT